MPRCDWLLAISSMHLWSGMTSWGAFALLARSTALLFMQLECMQVQRVLGPDSIWDFMHKQHLLRVIVCWPALHPGWVVFFVASTVHLLSNKHLRQPCLSSMHFSSLPS